LQVGGNTYLFGQSNGHQSKGYYWFIQQITDGGYMGPKIDDGYWGHYFQTVVPLQVGGNTYIFGQTTDHTSSGYPWFIQQITPGGWMGRTPTDSGYWGHYFQTVAPFQSGDNTYIFGQTTDHSSSGYFWFIQQITDGGWMGQNATASGYWGNFYNNVFAFNFSSQYQDVHNWMTQNWSILNDKTLGQIIIPGSHDSGMSLTQHCYAASDCNTKTQLYNIGQQLQNGSRYFDVRPVRDWGGGSFYTGHFGLSGGLAYGCEGQLLQDVLNEVYTFVQDNPNEIVVLKFSHCFELSHAVGGTKDDCAPDGTTALYVALVRATLGDMMYKCTGANCLANATLKDIRASGANVVALFGDNAASDTSHGVFIFDGDFSVHDDYSNTDNLNTMENDQISQLNTLSNHTSNNMYLTSWTLTMTATDAENCGSGVTKSIVEMSSQAAGSLIPEIWGMTMSGDITTSLLPNILYVDINDQFSARLAIMMNNHFYSESVDVPAGDFMMGCNSAVDLECSSDEFPYHQVTLADFSIDKNLVTAANYKQCVDHKACSAPGTGGNCTYGVTGKETYPVNCVTWNQAGAYCQWRGKHLPTEAQWEKAARGTDGRIYPWGNDNLDLDHAVMSANGYSSPDLQPIGSKPAGASPYGVLDMAGNASNWVADWYDHDYYSNSPVADPPGPSTGTLKVTRGGSYDTTLTSRMRTSNRSYSNPASAPNNVGFRCAK
jgi:formylglycine-generating enzyme required for sulfatase activity